MEDIKQSKVLLVDDEENVIRALKRTLHREGYQIFSALNGNEALDVMEEHSPQLVISDYKMPGMTGTELFKEIKKSWPDTIRILLTGYADLEASIAAINEGRVYRFILKPWNDEEFKLTIRQALKYQSLLSKNKLLLNKLQARDKLLLKIEQQNPGITKVKIDNKGAVIIDEDEDYTDIMNKMAI